MIDSVFFSKGRSKDPHFKACEAKKGSRKIRGKEKGRIYNTKKNLKKRFASDLSQLNVRFLRRLWVAFETRSSTHPYKIPGL